MNSHRLCALKSVDKHYVRTSEAIIRGKLAFCSEDHLVEHGVSAWKKLLKRANKAKARERAEKVRNFRLNDRGHQLRETQKEFNKLIRTLDAKESCISCDKGPDWHGQWHAGHFKTTGANGALRFNACNVFKQCSRCNLHLSGALDEYRKRLLTRFGQPFLDYLDGAHEVPKLTALDLAALRKVYSAEIRRLEKGEGPSRNWRRLPND